MTAMKVAELEGALLDAAVAKAAGDRFRFSDRFSTPTCEVYHSRTGPHSDQGAVWIVFQPSLSWATGGPIIERKHILVGPRTDRPKDAPLWHARIDAVFLERPGPAPYFEHPVPLVAAMRTFVASVFGDTVDL